VLVDRYGARVSRGESGQGLVVRDFTGSSCQTLKLLEFFVAADWATAALVVQVRTSTAFVSDDSW